MGARGQALLGIVVLGLVDIVTPLPVLGLFLIYAVLGRPFWFRRLVDDVYAAPHGGTRRGGQP
jgi:hypothetical protein